MVSALADSNLIIVHFEGTFFQCQDCVSQQIDFDSFLKFLFMLDLIFVM